MAKRKRKTKPRWQLAEVHRVVLVTGPWGEQAMYVDRRFKAERETFYPGDLDEETGSMAFTFTTADMDEDHLDDGHWPADLPADVDS